MQIVTLGDFLTWASSKFESSDIFYGHGTDNPWDEAVMLALYVLKLPAQNDLSLLEQRLSSQQTEELVMLAERRVSERIPVPYLSHEAWFAGERYYVNQDVLIPRSPLAETIANHFQPWLGSIVPHRILDLCTGSGCLAIYCAKQFPESTVDALDISPQALAVANINIKSHNCVNRVRTIQSDLFEAVPGVKYDIIVSNPPYVSAQAMNELPIEYKHEPILALASGTDGLDLTIKIINQARKNLMPHGLLIVEVGESWQTLADKYPEIAFTWLDFSYGGEGVFLLTAEYLNELPGELKL